jgi:hypothetical protein
MVAQRKQDVRSSFLKKRSKRLLCPGASGEISARHQTSRSEHNKSLFASFSSEKEDSSFFLLGARG